MGLEKTICTLIAKKNHRTTSNLNGIGSTNIRAVSMLSYATQQSFMSDITLATKHNTKVIKKTKRIHDTLNSEMSYTQILYYIVLGGSITCNAIIILIQVSKYTRLLRTWIFHTLFLSRIL